MRKEGYRYTTALNGLEAVEAFKSNRFSATVMGMCTAPSSKYTSSCRPDISMPVMDGLEATRKMRQYERANNLTPTPIIILTAVLSADMQQEAISSGVNQFLTKPTPLKQLKELLRNVRL